ncbi:MAG: hypothetical protein DME22_20545 [Verrucomicrobia bacterium]|nr:MAG: hypothetical protein DME22_20545 [Verrucomicrobiota bacterium]
MGRLLFKQRVIFIFNSMDGKQPPHRLKFAQKRPEPRPQQFSRSIPRRFTIALRFLRPSKTVALETQIAFR